MMGMCLTVSGAILYPIPCIRRWRLSRENKQTTLDPEINQQEQVAMNQITA